MILNEIPRFDNHSHSEYSNIRIIDSINRAGDMIETASKLGMKGLALTDHECLSGHIKFLDEEERLKKEGKIPEDFKCALGNEIYLVDQRDDIIKFFHYILIAKDTLGHAALRELSSIAWLNCFNSKGMTRVPTEKNELRKIVEKYKGHLIATTACLGGELPYYIAKYNELKKKIKSEQTIEIKNELEECITKIKEFLNFNLNLFGKDFYIEIAAAATPEQINFNKTIKEIAKQYGIKIVIGSDSHYLTAKERAMHKAYLNSKEADREVDDFYFYAHMMDNNEAYENLSSIFTEEEFVELCENSMEIYDKIKTYDLFHKPIIPRVEVKEYQKGLFKDIINDNYVILKNLLDSDNIQERYWINECLRELVRRKMVNEIYLHRLEKEARIIKIISEKLENCLFEYFNTFQHYIDLFWDNGSIVGPGRGSAVCFLSNYLLGITQLDPIKWNLAEWRFLNEERIELPKLKYWAV